MRIKSQKESADLANRQMKNLKKKSKNYWRKKKEKEEQLSQEVSFIMEGDVESEVLDDSMNSVILNSSLNRSGLSRNTKEYSHKNVQTEAVYQERPKIRKICDCTNAVKTTRVNLSVKCNMSPEMSRVSVQTVYKNLYDLNYFLSKD